MTPDDARGQYRDLMQQRGAPILLRRYTGSGTSRPKFDLEVLAVPDGNDTALLAGSVAQGKQRLIVLAQDVFDGQFPVPLRKDDKAVLRGRELNIEEVDDNTRRVGGELIAYVLTVLG